MKTYLLSIYQPDGAPPPPEILDPIMAGLAAINQEMVDTGAFVFTAPLSPAHTATTLRATAGSGAVAGAGAGAGADVLLTDGPFTEGKEHLGGFTVIRAPDLDAALEWGRRMAGVLAPLPVEVRPFSN